jgi:hypothetical protein
MIRPDPREVFLARAAARDRLVLEGEMSLAAAFNGLVPAFFEIVGTDYCNCTCEIAARLLAPPIEKIDEPFDDPACEGACDEAKPVHNEYLGPLCVPHTAPADERLHD